MFDLSIENSYGERLELTHNPNYTVYKVDGLEPPNANINTSQIANFDGGRFNSSRVNERNIVIYLTIDTDVERNRITLYRYVKPKQPIIVYYKNSTRDVFAEGYVESMQIGLFEQKQNVQISILCPYPHLKSVAEEFINFANVEPNFIFPFAYNSSGAPFSLVSTESEIIVENMSDIENGVVIDITAAGRCLNPVIYNHSRGEYFKLNVDLFSGDTIVIDTRKTKKKVNLTHDGTTTNVINNIERGSTWLQLLAGDNIMSYDADEYPENITVNMTYHNEYEGV